MKAQPSPFQQLPSNVKGIGSLRSLRFRFPEFFSQPVHDNFVQIVTSKVCITISCLLQTRHHQAPDRNIESTTTEVKHGNLLVFSAPYQGHKPKPLRWPFTIRLSFKQRFHPLLWLPGAGHR
jgi:hypothetical protein